MTSTDAPAELAKPVRTPAYEDGFGPNTDKLLHLLSFMGKGVAGYMPDVREIQTKVANLPSGDRDGFETGAKEALQALTKQLTELTGGMNSSQ